MTKPKLSIAIPTRNRSEYLIDSVNIVIEHCPGAQIVVSDNSDTDALRERLAAFIAAGTVVYDHCAELRSVVQNFERAVGLATGDWVMCIGDDDAIGPGLAEVVDWATDNGVEAVVSYGDRFAASYYWPGVNSKYYGDGYSSKLFIWPFSGTAKLIDGGSELRLVSSRLGGNLGALPRIYHGLVSRVLLNRIIKRHGHVFGGVSPDIFSAALISANSKRSAFVDFPFVIPGTSARSTAGQGAERSDRAQLRQTEHIARFGDGLQWDARIPDFYSPQTVWAYSLLKALEELPELGIKPSYGRLYARCLLYCRAYTDITWRTINSNATGDTKLRLIASIVKGITTEVGDLVGRIARRIASPRAMGNADRVENLETISVAYNALEEYIKKSGRSLRLPSGVDIH
jgi:glycosyltransferase involved in cell wall biosynthesis